MLGQWKTSPTHKFFLRYPYYCITSKNMCMTDLTQNLSDLDFDFRGHSRSDVTAIGLPVQVYGFLLLFNVNTGLTGFFFEM